MADVSHPPPSAHVDVVDMTVADTDTSDSGQPLRNRENDFQRPCRRRTSRRIHSSGSEGVPQVRQSPFAVLTGESEENMPARIGGSPFSSGNEEVNANCAPELPEVITVLQSVPARPARLRLLKRMLQATTDVAPSGGDHEVQQEVSRRHGTWVELTVEDSDPGDEEWDSPVESDHDSDCVLDALQRDLEVDLASACPAAADAPHFGRVAVQATPSQDSQSVTKRLRVVVSPTPRTTQLEGESAIARRSATATLEDTVQPSLLQHEGPVGPPVARNPGEHDSESDSTESMREVPRRRRLVLLPRISGVGVVPEDHESIVSQAVPRADAVPQRRALSQGLRSLDGVDLADVFTRRALVMRSVPRVLQGPYIAAVRLSLQEVSRAWKLFLLLPRMLLWRPPRGGLVPKRHLEGRLRLFVAGEWTELLQQGAVHGAAAAVGKWSSGELSAGRQALEGESVAPGTLRTLRALTDPERRPEVPREPLLPEFSHHVPRARVVLDSELCTTNLRKSRRGAAGGPSGMTAEHLKGLLESEDDSLLLVDLANSLAQPDVPSDIVHALRLGRITALQKPDTGVRGIVVGDWQSNFRSRPKKRRLLTSMHWKRGV